LEYDYDQIIYDREKNYFVAMKGIEIFKFSIIDDKVVFEKLF
jgi:hypothetical protein